MTTTDIAAATIAAHFAAMPLPEAPYALHPHLLVLDLPAYIDLNITRLESTSARLRRLAFQALDQLATQLGHPLPEG